ncbi:MAG: hypothetical protein HYS22_09045 [Deltaproteobacteria bacterium]|nr:hypothetical protein [Deltaproteobacteria bacterium]
MRQTQLTVILLLVSLLSNPSLLAKKKKEESGGLKKIIAIGSVENGYLGFENMEPGGVNDLLRDRIRKELEETGRYVVLMVQPEKPVEAVESLPAASESPPETQETEVKEPPKKFSPQDAKALMAQSQQLLQQMVQTMRAATGGPMSLPKSVAAQSLFNFLMETEQSSSGTGGVFGIAEGFTSTPLGLGDFSSESVKLVLTTKQMDPERGILLDHHRAKASSTRFTQLAGVNYYSVEDSSNSNKAFDKVFKKALKKTVEWVDGKMSPLAWEGQIFKKEGDQFYLNAGATAGVKPSTQFVILKKEAVAGKGVQFGTQEEARGILEVVRVEEKYSLCRLVSGTVEVGAIIRQGGSPASSSAPQ